MMIHKLVVTPIVSAFVISFVLFSQQAFALKPIPQGPADTIVYNAHIITLDDHDFNANPGTIVQAMAMRNGVIQAVGSEKEVMTFKGPETEMLNMHGKTVVPGIINVHYHPQNGMRQNAREMFNLPAGLAGYYINMVVEATPDQTLAKIANAVDKLHKYADVQPTDWIGIELFPDGVAYTSLGSVSQMMSAPKQKDVQIGTEDLSEIIPNNPAVLMSGGGINEGVSERPKGIWYHVTLAKNGNPVIEELFKPEF